MGGQRARPADRACVCLAVRLSRYTVVHPYYNQWHISEAPWHSAVFVVSLALRAAHPRRPCSAQVRQITGRVTNPQTGQGVPEATVAVTGTQIVAQTGNDGRYSLNAPGPASSTLVVRGIGYKRQTVTVPPAQATADVALEPDVFKLEEIVDHRAGHRRRAAEPAQRGGDGRARTS